MIIKLIEKKEQVKLTVQPFVVQATGTFVPPPKEK